MSIPQDRKPKPGANSAPASGPVTVTLAGSDVAPFLYCDGVAAFGSVNGIVQLELAANSFLPIDRGGKTDVRSRLVAVAHLRCSLAAAQNLRDVIDQALALAQPQPAPAQPKAPTSSKFAGSSRPNGAKPGAPKSDAAQPTTTQAEG